MTSNASSPFTKDARRNSSSSPPESPLAFAADATRSVVPPGVADPDPAEVQGHRQRPEPRDDVAMPRGVPAHLVQERAVLRLVLRRVRAQPAGAVLAPGRVADGVEFVVAHHDQGAARRLHPAHDLEHLDLAGPAVDQVAHEHGHPALRVAVDPSAQAVTQLREQRLELPVLPVHIADHVVSHLVLSPLSCITPLTILDFVADCN